MSVESETGLKIQVFGSLRITRDREELPLRSRKAQGLLALLLLRAGREVGREWLAETLWPDDEIENRQANLRQRLADLRRALGSDRERLQSPTNRTLCFDTSAVEVDVLAFDRAISKGHSEGLNTAVALYHGPLLEDSTELWVLREREQRQQAFLKALESLAQFSLTAGDRHAAIEFLRRGVRVDLWRQSLHRLLMQVHALQGDFESALRVYTDLSEALHRQHNALPEAETRLLYQEMRAKARANASPARKSDAAIAGNRTETAGRTDSAAVSAGSSTASAPACHVPVPLTSMIGRTAEMRAIQAHLLTARLVTLTGIGGSGKTRLAIEAGRDMASEFPGGVYFVDLSGINNQEQIPQTAAAALRISGVRGKSWLETLQEVIHSRHLLLILDNCEHLQQACVEFAQSLLQTCLFLRILATSRQPLRLTGEVVLPVAPLPLPEPGLDSPEELVRIDSIQFFQERAQSVRSDFAVTSLNAAMVVRLCRMLDGLPLALELAAGLAEILTVEEINEHLEERRLEIQHADSTIPARHRSLQAMLEWSYRLLSAAEQRSFARMSVFAGGFTRAAVEAVCSDAPQAKSSSPVSLDARPPAAGRRIESPNDGERALEMLARLVSKSLVIADQREARTRYRLLETVRVFAAMQLEASGEIRTARERFLRFYSEMASAAEPGLTGPEQAAWIERLEQEHVNLHAALRMHDTEEMTRAALHLANSLGRFWQVRGYFAEGRETLERLLAATEAEADTRERADVMNWAGILAVYQSDYEAAHRFCRKAREIWEALDDMRGLGGALGGLGMIAKDTGDLPGAQRLFAESLEASRRAGDRLGEAGSLGYLGIVAASQGDADTARACYQASLSLRRDLQDQWGIAASLNNLALLARECGQIAEARTLIEESIAIRRQLGDRRSLAISLNVLGEMFCEAGDPEGARSLLIESLRLCRELGDRRSVAFSLEHFALLANHLDKWEEAARLYGAADALRERISAPLSPGNKADRARVMQTLKGVLGEIEFQLSYYDGQNTDLDSLLEEISGGS